MRAFAMVAELEGFTPAAKRLRLSPPAVTRLVAALEEKLGVRLLQRTTRSVKLTSAGERYLDRVRRILSDVVEAESVARSEQTVPMGRFVVTAPNLFGRLNVAPLLAEYLKTRPLVRGELLLDDRMVNLVEDGIDVAIRIGVLKDSTLHARSVGATRRVVVGSPGYFLKRSRPRAPKDLAKHELVQFTPMAPTRSWIFARNGREVRIGFQPAFITNSGDAAITYAEHGAGLAMVLAYQVAAQVKKGLLEVVLPNFEPAPLPIQLVYPASRLPSANLRAFMDHTIHSQKWSFVNLGAPTKGGH